MKAFSFENEYVKVKCAHELIKSLEKVLTY